MIVWKLTISLIKSLNLISSIDKDVNAPLTTTSKRNKPSSVLISF